MKTLKIGLVIFSILLVFSCNNNEDGTANEDSFNRKELLAVWADDMIIPAFEKYQEALHHLDGATNGFYENANISTYDNLVEAWISAYISWQSVAMFDIGKAEEIKLRNFTNIYPVDEDLVLSNIVSQNYNLALPSNYDAQGFPALDFLLFGLGDTKADIITILTDEKYAQYFKSIVLRLITLTTDVVEDWKTSYRNTFIENDGASATASVDKVVNDYIFNYEKYFRAGKVGIPAGVFSGSPLSSTVEAPYSAIYSKALWSASFIAIKRFFNGLTIEGETESLSLKSYLQHVMEQNGTHDIAEMINTQWSEVDSKVMEVDNNFMLQVETDNTKMLTLYDAMQKAVVLLKVDMMQALNIQVDYVDADGD